MADAAPALSLPSVVPVRHTLVIRTSHWVTAACFIALLISGIEVTISHPRFYWGEVGNVFTPPLFSLPIPASRSAVPTGYGFVLPDQNGWSRSLHFQAAWALVLTGLVYVGYGLVTRHFWRHLLLTRTELTLPALSRSLLYHLRFMRPSEAETWSYNLLQRLAYLCVIFVLFPLMIWTGLAMSPAIVSVFPGMVGVLGGHQSARTVHFFVSAFLVLFLILHVVMVWRAGFIARTLAITTGRSGAHKEFS